LTLSLTFGGESVVRPVSIVVHAISRVAGRVVVDGAGTPLAGVRIDARGPEDRSATTGPDGLFLLELVEGTYAVRAHLDGYCEERWSVTVPPHREDLVVAMGWSEAVVSPASIERACGAGASCDAVVTVTNGGTRPLEYHAAFRPIACPDGTGCSWPYRVLDPAEPGTPAVAWAPMDDATVVATNGDDVLWGPFSLPFPFPFYGQDLSSLYISSNGFVSFAPFAAESYDNVALPSVDAPPLMIAPLWDDLVVEDRAEDGGRVLLLLEDDRCVVEFRNVVHYDGSPLFSFQLTLTLGGAIGVRYRYVPWDVLSATVGVQDAERNRGLDVPPSALAARSLVLGNAPSWASVEPLSGSVAAGTVATVLLTVRSPPAVDTLETLLVLRSTSSRTPQSEVHVTVRAGVTGWHFLRGDANGDALVNIADAISALGYLFSQGAVPCQAALDANGDGGVQIADPVYVLGFLFAGGQPPGPPFPACGWSERVAGFTCAQEACAP
jgi:hypothetical protein